MKPKAKPVRKKGAAVRVQRMVGPRQELVDISHYVNHAGQIGRFGGGWPAGPLSLMWANRPNEKLTDHEHEH